MGGIVPESWIEIARALQASTGCTAVVAGGAVRDTAYGRPIKDIDIFVHRDFWQGINFDEFEVGPTFEDEVRSVMESLGFVRARTLYLEYIARKEAIISVDYRKAGHLPVNITFMRDPVSPDICARHDFGICQMAADDSGFIVGTEAAIRDRDNKTFTLIREEDRERSMKRWHRLHEKYPEFTLVIPEVGALCPICDNEAYTPGTECQACRITVPVVREDPRS